MVVVVSFFRGQNHHVCEMVIIILKHLDPVWGCQLVLAELCEAVDWGSQFWKDILLLTY